ncbi:replication initiation protein [Domibacillus aminovorans]|uniref:Initiator RepB protein n=1 Tax=Domibacillus aminovorans TaxID=29332 RepID=A0A177L6W9_9BACI|nr:initiator RepB protein [Domibacillus aminovorans]
MLLTTATEVIEPHPNNLVTKSNLLIEANYKLGVVEQKIILCLASNISPADSDFKTYTLPIKEFTNLLGLKGTPKYTELRQITKELMQKVFEVRIDRKVIQVSWLSYVAYNETEGAIDIRFDPFLRPYLLELKKEFTSYKLENIIKLKSSYSIRIYELLKQYEKLQERTFQLTSLRKMLGAEEIYPAYGNFKQRVLVPAQKELKMKTDISFEIEEVKKGRKVEKIKFLIFSTRNHKSKQLDLFHENLEEFKLPNSFSETVKKLGLNVGIQLTDEMINSWEKHGQDTVIDLLEKMQYRRDIENPVGYIIKVLNTPGANEITSENGDIVAHLVSEFRQSKEHLPDWLVKRKSIEEIKTWMTIDQEQANQKFEDIKNELYEILQIEELNNSERSDEEMEEEKRILLKRIHSL